MIWSKLEMLAWTFIIASFCFVESQRGTAVYRGVPRVFAWGRKIDIMMVRQSFRGKEKVKLRRCEIMKVRKMSENATVDRR